MSESYYSVLKMACGGGGGCDVHKKSEVKKNSFYFRYVSFYHVTTAP